jgi:hypothetical protein
MGKNILSSNYVLLTGVIFSAIMLAGATVPSLFSMSAFADSNIGGVVVDPSIQTAVQTAANVNVDTGVILSTGCGEINDDDEVTQVNEQNADQQADKKNDAGDNGVVVDPSVQAVAQTAANVNVDSDVYIILGCNDGHVKISDDDKVTQVNEQNADQEVNNDSDVGDNGVHISPIIQKSANTAKNIDVDKDRVIMIPLPDV